ncbi:MAG: hypothetical protein JXQ82_01640 [Methanomicrobiaceae archaeon]|nr:hypothetical protein [Methanomicrobiaceae archaeon]
MPDTRSFARDWQLLKLSRDWKPADRSIEILDGLVKDNDPLIIEKIEKIVNEIGKHDAEEILQRMHPKMDIEAILEGILLVSGIAYETFEDNDGKKIKIKKEMRSSLSKVVSDNRISAAYIRGFIEIIIPGSEIRDRGDHFTLVRG